MAGIGFELRRVAGKGGLGSFIGISLSGAMIVAGPWILSIITVSAVRLIMERTGNDAGPFMAVIIYSYAFSLFIFGGFHYLATRRLADLLYEKKENEALWYVLILLVPAAAVSLAIGIPASFLITPPDGSPLLFRVSAAALFCIVNCLWFIMLFVSVLKQYTRILAAFILGLAASTGLIAALTPVFGTPGALAGFAAGHAVIVVLLVILALTGRKPRKPEFPDSHTIRRIIKYAAKHGNLFLSGAFLYWGLWCDKFIWWMYKGENVPGTFMKLYDVYDIPVFLGNLTMIPGLIFFIIIPETEIYTALRKLLFVLQNGTFSQIAKARCNLKKTTLRSLYEEALFQGLFSLCFIAAVPETIFKLSFAAAFFYLMLLSLLNTFYYIICYRDAFICALIFCVLNLGISILCANGTISMPPGASFLAAAAGASIFAAVILNYRLDRVERYILTQ